MRRADIVYYSIVTNGTDYVFIPFKSNGSWRIIADAISFFLPKEEDKSLRGHNPILYRIDVITCLAIKSLSFGKLDLINLTR